MSFVDAVCLPGDDEHPATLRRGGLRLWGRCAAYEATGTAVVFGLWVTADVVWRRVTGRS